MQSIHSEISLPTWLQNLINKNNFEKNSVVNPSIKNSIEEYYDLAYKRVVQIDNLSMLIPDSSVGVIDATGKYISEQNGSFGLCCSGYAKWIADGFYYPLRKSCNENTPQVAS